MPHESDTQPIAKLEKERRDGVLSMHDPLFREKADPNDGFEPTPLWLVFMGFILIGWGGWYLGTYSGGFNSNLYWEHVEAGPMAAVPGAGAGASDQAPDMNKIGKRVYAACTGCHGADGQGVAGAFPPLAGSERVVGDERVLAAILLHGLEGPVVVRGVTYNQQMPKWSQLSDEKIAAVLTYIRGAWGNEAPPVETEVVAAVRSEFADRQGVWSDAELDAL